MYKIAIEKYQNQGCFYIAYDEFEKGFQLIDEHDKLIKIDNLFIFTLSSAPIQNHVWYIY